MDIDVNYNYKGNEYALNINLVLRQKLSQETVDKLKRSHILKRDIFELMEKTEISNSIRLVMLMKRIERVEFIQQELWGFGKDRNFHYWTGLPHCSCPKLDNRENYGTPFRITMDDCPLHGLNSTKDYDDYINRIIKINKIIKD